MASLAVLRGEEEGEVFALDTDETDIGREEGCAIRLEGLGLSRRHCAISRTGGHFLLRDLDSENGTWVNGERITERELRDGDQVGLGVQASLRFHNEAQSGAPSAPEAPPVRPPGEGGVMASEPKREQPREDEPGDSRAARWLLILALVGLAVLIGVMIEFSLSN